MVSSNEISDPFVPIFYVSIIYFVGFLYEYHFAASQNYQNAIKANLCSQLLPQLLNRRRANAEHGATPPKKRRKTLLDHKRAEACITADYLGPMPAFDDKQFERIFRISKTMYQRIRSIAATSAIYFYQIAVNGHLDACKRPAISLDAKLLMGLKLLCYGVSANAFRDYFQMGERTAHHCETHLVELVCNSSQLTNTYLREMTAFDVLQVTSLHQTVHGIEGLLGSLDCTHRPWKNCPKAYEGIYTCGKEGHPTIMLEATCDYNLWIWHASFGTPGSAGDLNAWANSSLLRSFLNGTAAQNDFSFQIGQETFRRCFYFVDGIYPPLSRFVKSLSIPITTAEIKFAAWHEACRKDIERAFGILKCRFRTLLTPSERWCIEHIKKQMYCCIILHNMTVEERIKQAEGPEYDMFYGDVDVMLTTCNLPIQNLEDDIVAKENKKQEDIDRCLQQLKIIRQHDKRYRNLFLEQEEKKRQMLDQRTQYSLARWSDLKNVDEHLRLQKSMISLWK